MRAFTDWSSRLVACVALIIVAAVPLRTARPSAIVEAIDGSCVKLLAENSELRRRLEATTRRALQAEDQLKAARHAAEAKALTTPLGTLLVLHHACAWLLHCIMLE